MSTRAIALALATALLAGCGSTQPYQGLTSDEIYAIAVQEYAAGEYDNAIRALDRLFISFAGFPQTAEARLLLANAHFGKRDYLTARSEYMRFLDRHSGHPEAPTAALGVCRSLAALSPIPARDQTYTQDAQAICRNVVVDYGGTEAAVQAAEISNRMRLKLAHKEYLNAEFYYKRGLLDSAVHYFEFVVELYPDTEWAPMSLLGIYRANKAFGYDDLAEEARERLLNEYPDSPAAEEIRANGDGGG